MAYVFNPFTCNLDDAGGIKQGSSDPAGGGDFLFINTSTNELKVYYGGSWQVIATLIAGAASHLLMENGDNFALENGDILTLE